MQNTKEHILKIMVCAHLSTLLLSLQSKKHPVTVRSVRLSAVLCSFHSEHIMRELKLTVCDWNTSK